MAKARRKKRVNYLRTLVEARNANPATLAKYLRERFEQEAQAAEGHDALLARVVKMHEVERKPLSDQEAPPPAAKQAAAAAPAAPKSSSMEDAANVFAGAIGKALDAQKGPKEDPPRPCEPYEYREGVTRVTTLGDFPEAAQHPVLAKYRRERDEQDLIYFRGPDNRRLMLGKIVEIFPQENFRGGVHSCVNGLMVAVPREKRCGVPIPHFEQIRGAHDASPLYGTNGLTPPTQNSDGVPDAPPPPMILKRQTYNLGVYGDCLCDPLTLAIVVELTTLVSTIHSIAPERMELAGSSV